MEALKTIETANGNQTKNDFKEMNAETAQPGNVETLREKCNKEIETIFMTTSADYMFLSSSVVKEVCKLGGDVSTFVPEQISDDIIARLSK